MTTPDHLTTPVPVLIPRYVRVLEEYGRARGMMPGSITISDPAGGYHSGWRFLESDWTGTRAAFLSLGWTVPSFRFGITRQGHAATLRERAPVRAGHVWCDGDAVTFKVELGRVPLTTSAAGDIEELDFGGEYTALHGPAESMSVGGVTMAEVRRRRSKQWAWDDRHLTWREMPDGTILVQSSTRRARDLDALACSRADRARVSALEPSRWRDEQIEEWDERIAELLRTLGPKLRLVVDNTRGEA